MTRLSLANLAKVKAEVRRPAYDPATLACGLLHLGVGAFHRAHQAVFTEDAIEAAGGGWGIMGVSLRRADAARALNPQNGLFTLERRSAEPDYRIVGALRQVLAALNQPEAVLEAFAAPELHCATITVTEAGYALGPDGALDFGHPDVASDLSGANPPRSTVGWLVEGLARRRAREAGPLTVISCDNLRDNGRKLQAAVQGFAKRRSGALAGWITANVAFPNTMVDAITPASDTGLIARVEAATGLQDRAAVQREPFAQWVIEDRFEGPRPAWERAGAQIVADVARHETLKLHVLNAAHSALAELGLRRGYAFVRQASADPDLARTVEAMVLEEVAPALPALNVAGYWTTVKARFAQPAIDHRLDQIARDGALKLRERIHPIMLDNVRAGRPAARLAGIVGAWLDRQGLDRRRALEDPAVFADAFRAEPPARTLVLDAPELGASSVWV